MWGFEDVKTRSENCLQFYDLVSLCPPEADIKYLNH